jgi:hypothetical protein
MKTFKGYLDEDSGKFKGDLYMTPVKTLAMDMHVKLPISKPIMNRLFGEKTEIKCYHVLSGNSVYKLVAGQNKKYSISTMTNIIKSDFLRIFNVGVMDNGGGILSELTANPIAGLAYDAFTDADTTGRRWIPIKNIFLNDPSKAEKHIEGIIKIRREVIDSLWEKYAEVKEFTMFKGRRVAFDDGRFKGMHNNKILDMLYDHMEKAGASKKEINKVKSILIRSLIDKYEQYMNKHIKEFEKALTSDTHNTNTFNEIIVNEYSIDKFHCIFTKEAWMKANIKNVKELAKYRIEVENEDKYDPWEVWSSPGDRTMFLEFCDGVNLIDKSGIPYTFATDDFGKHINKSKLWKTVFK